MSRYYKLADDYLQRLKDPRIRASGKKEMLIIREDRAERIHYILKPFLNSTRPKCLDIGCGLGDISLGLADYGYEVVGIDSDPEAIEIANIGKICSGKDVRFFVFNAENLNKIFPHNSFDVVLMNGVLEHLKNPGKVLKNVYYILKPDGWLYLSTPNKLFPIDLHSGILFKSWLDSNLYTWKGLKRVLERNGFKVYDMTPFIAKNFSKVYDVYTYHSPLKYGIYEKAERFLQRIRSDVIINLFAESFIVLGSPIRKRSDL